MRILIQCNIDDYRGILFSDNLLRIPNEREFIAVKDEYRQVLIEAGLPTELQVKKVTHFEAAALLELHFSEQQVKLLLLHFGKQFNIRK
jgi:hypothetical protein